MTEKIQKEEEEEKKIWHYILAIIGGIFIFLGSLISGKLFKPSTSTTEKYLGFILFIVVILLLYLWIRY